MVFHPKYHKNDLIMKISALLFCSLFGLLLTNSPVQAQTDANNFIGSWEYTGQHAPYAYRQGKLVITQEHGKTSVKIVFSNENKIQAEKVTVEDEQLRFSIYVENEYVPVKLELKKENKITGFADTTTGKIALTATRQ